MHAFKSTKKRIGYTILVEHVIGKNHLLHNSKKQVDEELQKMLKNDIELSFGRLQSY